MNAPLPSRLSWWLLLILACVAGCRGPASAHFRYEPAIVELSGTVSMQEAFGPPGYGETPAQDRREKYLLLTLDTPICVTGDPASAANAQGESNVKAVQMVYGVNHPFQQEWVNRHVSVTGTLSHAVTGHHRTPVLVQVTATRLTGSDSTKNK